MSNNEVRKKKSTKEEKSVGFEQQGLFSQLDMRNENDLFFE